MAHILKSQPISFGLLLALLGSLGGCGSGSASSKRPSTAIDILVSASAQNNADAVYALLSKDVQKRVSKSEFRELWNKHERERELWAAEASPNEQIENRQRATLTYSDGKKIGLVKQGESWRLTTALVAEFYAASPKDAVRYFIQALDNSNVQPILRVLSPERKSTLSSVLVDFRTSIATALDNPITILGKDRAELDWAGENATYRLITIRRNGSWFIDELHTIRHYSK